MNCSYSKSNSQIVKIVKYTFIAKKVEFIIIPCRLFVLIASISPTVEVYTNNGEPKGLFVAVKIAASTRKKQLIFWIKL